MFEFDFVTWLIENTRQVPGVLLGPGDDAAILAASPDRVVITTDLLADGVHFVVGQTPLELIGRKAIAVSLSDIAAMGAKPTAAVLNLCLPKAMSLPDAKTLFIGAVTIATQFSVPIVGGDTNRWEQGLVIGSTVLGRINHAGWRMNGATVGDSVFVTGPLGGSLSGKHLTFTPRCKLAEYLAEHFEIHAATDISDSLAIDANEIAEQSGVGIELNPDKIPIAIEAVERLSQSPQSQTMTPLEHALYDGEDFELILAFDPSEAARASADPNLAGSLFEIGRVIDRPGLWLAGPGHKRQQLRVKGFEH